MGGGTARLCTARGPPQTKHLPSSQPLSMPFPCLGALHPIPRSAFLKSTFEAQLQGHLIQAACCQAGTIPWIHCDPPPFSLPPPFTLLLATRPLHGMLFPAICSGSWLPSVPRSRRPSTPQMRTTSRPLDLKLLKAGPGPRGSAWAAGVQELLIIATHTVLYSLQKTRLSLYKE